MRLAAIDWKKIVGAILACNEPVKTGADEHRQLHEPLRDAQQQGLVYIFERSRKTASVSVLKKDASTSVIPSK
jgi:hypothetical protein